MHLSMSSQQGGRGEGGEGAGHKQGFDRSLWPGVGRLNYLAVLGVGIFEFFLCPRPQIISRGGEFRLYLTSIFARG